MFLLHAGQQSIFLVPELITVEENQAAQFVCILNTPNVTVEDSNQVLSVRRPGESNFSALNNSEGRVLIGYNPPNVTFSYLNVDGDDTGTEFRCSLFDQVSNIGILEVVGRSAYNIHCRSAYNIHCIYSSNYIMYALNLRNAGGALQNMLLF